MNKLVFTTHAKERALERMLSRKAPFECHELEDIEQLVRANMILHPFKKNKWILPDFGLELVTKNNIVVTVKEPPKAFYDYEHYNMKKMRKRDDTC